MTNGNQERRQTEDYLLGRLTAEEREAVSQRLLEDREFHEVMLDAENDLIDALAAGRLDPERAAQFRSHLEGTGQLDRLRFAEAWGARRAPAGRARVNWIGVIGVAASLLLAIALQRVYSENARLRAELPQRAVSAVSSTQPLVFFLASGGSLRGEGVPVLRKGAVRLIELHLEPPSPEGSYTVQLFRSGQLVLEQRGVPVRDNRVTVWFAAELLPAGPARLDLTREGRLAESYAFNVE